MSIGSEDAGGPRPHGDDHVRLSAALERAYPAANPSAFPRVCRRAVSATLYEWLRESHHRREDAAAELALRRDQYLADRSEDLTTRTSRALTTIRRLEAKDAASWERVYRIAEDLAAELRRQAPRYRFAGVHAASAAALAW
jgi:hypothetical protein